MRDSKRGHLFVQFLGSEIKEDWITFEPMKFFRKFSRKFFRKFPGIFWKKFSRIFWKKFLILASLSNPSLYFQCKLVTHTNDRHFIPEKIGRWKLPLSFSFFLSFLWENFSQTFFFHSSCPQPFSPPPLEMSLLFPLPPIKIPIK